MTVELHPLMLRRRALLGQIPLPPAPLLLETFTRGNSTNNMGSADTGQAWTTHVGTCGVNGNQGYASALVSGQAVASIDVGVADYDVTVTMAPGAGVAPRNMGFLFRLTDANNTLMARLTDSGVTLHKRSAGNFTQLGTTVALAGANSYLLRVLVVGDDITIWIDGVQRIAHTLSASDFADFGSQARIGARFQDLGNRLDNINAMPAAA